MICCLIKYLLLLSLYVNIAMKRERIYNRLILTIIFKHLYLQMKKLRNYFIMIIHLAIFFLTYVSI